MTFLIAAATHDHLVIAADSRGTWTTPIGEHGKRYHHHDGAQKLFLTKQGFALGFTGELSPTVAEEALARAELLETADTPRGFARHLCGALREVTPMPALMALVIGYDRTQASPVPCAIRVDVAGDRVRTRDFAANTIEYMGDGADIFVRLDSSVRVLNAEPQIEFPRVAWRFFTSGEAVRFVRWAVSTVTELQHFQSQPRTVGGLVRVITMNAERSWWAEESPADV